MRTSPKILDPAGARRPGPAGRRTGLRLYVGAILAGLTVLLMPTIVDAHNLAVPNPTPDRAIEADVSATRILGLGDCVMLGASPALQAALPGVEIDAAVSRQAATGINILRARVANGTLPEVLIFHLGNNGPMPPAQFDEVMDAAAGVRRVIFVNLTVPRYWEAPNNAVLADGVLRYPNAVLVDWHGLTAANSGLLWEDGIHLRPSGAEAYAALVAPYATAPLVG